MLSSLPLLVLLKVPGCMPNQYIKSDPRLKFDARNILILKRTRHLLHLVHIAPSLVIPFVQYLQTESLIVIELSIIYKLDCL
ncbi:hypothetical protein F4824DRAFT_447839, partial [Ustulina deusta]